MVRGAPGVTERRRVVLAGAGHAHLFTLRHARRFAARGHDLVLIAPKPFRYSGLATGVLGGFYPAALSRIDVGALALRGGADVVTDAVGALDPVGNRLFLEGGGIVAFDALSLALGSAPAPLPGEAGRRDCFPVKPVARLFALRAELERRIAAGQRPRLVVAGGGVAGFEVAGNLLALGRRSGAALDVTLLAAGGRLLRQLPRAAAQAVADNLAGRGARILRERRVVRVEEGFVVTDRGEAHGFDLFVNATGPVPHPLARQAGLPLRDGAMLVDAHLRSPANPRIHGGGDCVALAGHALPKAGVFAVRQGPVLCRNLLAAVEDRRPARFAPQRRYLAVMNLGDGSGLAVRGKLWWHGRLALRLKDWIDRRFLRSHRA